MGCTIIDERMTMDELADKYPGMWAVLYNMVQDDSGCPIEAMVYSVAPLGSGNSLDMNDVNRKYGNVKTMLWSTSLGKVDGGNAFYVDL